MKLKALRGEVLSEMAKVPDRQALAVHRVLHAEKKPGEKCPASLMTGAPGRI